VSTDTDTENKLNWIPEKAKLGFPQKQAKPVLQSG
jgi:hypothetical protein